MFFFDKYQYYYSNIHMNEKLGMQFNSDTTFFIKSANFLIYFKNKIEYLPLFSAVIVLLERITGQRVSFTFTNKTIPSFNIKQDDVVGIKVTLRSHSLKLFLHSLYTYSFGKIFVYPDLYSSERKIETVEFTFGLTKLLFFTNLSGIPDDWDLFSYLFDEMTYGLTLQLSTGYFNIFVNRLIASHYGLV